MASKLFIVILFCFLPFVVLCNILPPTFPFFSKIQLPPKVTGPECIAFDSIGGGPYVSVADGRILKWLSPAIGFIEFAHTSPYRNSQLCDGTTDPNLGPVCGRPLGLSFDPRGNLYIADAYFGLEIVGPEGGLAIQIATSAEGVPFRLVDDVDVDPAAGTVYFTEASQTFELRNVTQSGFPTDSTGRLMKYDPKTNQVTVLLRRLAAAGGPALSADRSFVLVSEYNAKRIQKFWLTGPKANTAEILTNLSGNPNKIKRNPSGDFWVAVNVITQRPTPLTVPEGVKISAIGKVLETISFSVLYSNTPAGVVVEHNGSLFVGSPFTNFVAVFKLPCSVCELLV